MPDYAFAVDEQDTVVNVLEHAGVLLEGVLLLFDLSVQSARPDRSRQRGDEIVAVNWLRDVVIGTASQGLNRQVVLAVARHQKRRRRRPQPLELGEQAEPVHSR